MYAVSIIGALLTIWGIWSFNSNRKFMKAAIKTEGKIADVVSERRSSTDEDGYTNDYTVYVPKINFLADGKEYTFKANIESRSKRKYKVGNDMTVYYDPEDPSKAKVKSTVNNFIMPIVLVIVGLMMVVIGFGGGNQ